MLLGSIDNYYCEHPQIKITMDFALRKVFTMENLESCTNNEEFLNFMQLGIDLGANELDQKNIAEQWDKIKGARSASSPPPPPRPSNFYETTVIPSTGGGDIPSTGGGDIPSTGGGKDGATADPFTLSDVSLAGDAGDKTVSTLDCDFDVRLAKEIRKKNQEFGKKLSQVVDVNASAIRVNKKLVAQLDAQTKDCAEKERVATELQNEKSALVAQINVLTKYFDKSK